MEAKKTKHMKIKDFTHTLPQGKFLFRLFPLGFALGKKFLHTLRTFTKILHMKGKR